MCIVELCECFSACPCYFYTENDIVSYFYSLLQQNLPVQKARDRDGHEHFIVHREYPTPFRCDMGKNRFVLKDDDARTERGGRYQRGHYDIVVLNPDFISHHSFEILKAQYYELYKERVMSNINECSPVILYGLEFMYSRDPFKYSRGESQERSIDDYVAKVKQDADKLIASRNIKGFMGEIKMLSFIKGSSSEICSLMSAKLQERNEIVLCCA